MLILTGHGVQWAPSHAVRCDCISGNEDTLGPSKQFSPNSILLVTECGSTSRLKAFGIRATLLRKAGSRQSPGFNSRVGIFAVATATIGPWHFDRTDRQGVFACVGPSPFWPCSAWPRPTECSRPGEPILLQRTRRNAMSRRRRLADTSTWFVKAARWTAPIAEPPSAWG